MKRIGVIVFLVIVTHCCMSFAAGFPYTLNYQGMLTSKTGQQVNEPQDITFNLYTTPIGAELPFWTETLVKVPVSNGQLSVTLGTVKTLDPSKFSGDTYLGIKVGTQAEMLPRQKMTSVPYAFNGIPTGGIIMWSGITVPSGWALCDGSNQTPDLREKFIMGASSTYVIGSIGGEASHVLTVSEMPSHNHVQDVHNHTQNAHNHYYTMNFANSFPGGTDRPLYYGTSTNNVATPYISSTTATNQPTTATNQPTGSGAAHNNLPPYYALAFIMKL